MMKLHSKKKLWAQISIEKCLYEELLFTERFQLALFYFLCECHTALVEVCRENFHSWRLLTQLEEALLKALSKLVSLNSQLYCEKSAEQQEALRGQSKLELPVPPLVAQWREDSA